LEKKVKFPKLKPLQGGNVFLRGITAGKTPFGKVPKTAFLVLGQKFFPWGNRWVFEKAPGVGRPGITRVEGGTQFRVVLGWGGRGGKGKRGGAGGPPWGGVVSYGHPLRSRFPGGGPRPPWAPPFSSFKGVGRRAPLFRGPRGPFGPGPRFFPHAFGGRASGGGRQGGGKL